MAPPRPTVKGAVVSNTHFKSELWSKRYIDYNHVNIFCQETMKNKTLNPHIFSDIVLSSPVCRGDVFVEIENACKATPAVHDCKIHNKGLTFSRPAWISEARSDLKITWEGFPWEWPIWRFFKPLRKTKIVLKYRIVGETENREITFGPSYYEIRKIGDLRNRDFDFS